MADDDEDIAALVVDNGSGMCKGMLTISSFLIGNALRLERFGLGCRYPSGCLPNDSERYDFRQQ